MGLRKFLWRFAYSVVAALLALATLQAVEAATGNIDPVNKWAWGTNIGWVNFNAASGGVTVCADHLEGYAWSENVGWIKLGTVSGCPAHSYGNASLADYGVNRDSGGHLSGYAWSASAGWINFGPANGGVTLDSRSGSFDGYAWGENIGWVHFKNTTGVPYGVAIVKQLLKYFMPMAGRH